MINHCLLFFFHAKINDTENEHFFFSMTRLPLILGTPACAICWTHKFLGNLWLDTPYRAVHLWQPTSAPIIERWFMAGENLPLHASWQFSWHRNPQSHVASTGKYTTMVHAACCIGVYAYVLTCVYPKIHYTCINFNCTNIYNKKDFLLLLNSSHNKNAISSLQKR